MEQFVPQSSDRLAEVANLLARNPAVIVERANQALLHGDKAYAGSPPSIRSDVRESIEFAAQLWLRAVVNGRQPSEEDLLTLEESGRRRVHQGISLSSLLHGVRLGARELWRTLLENCSDDQDVREQLLSLFSPFLLEFFDSISQRLASAYVDEQYQRARWRDALRYELLSIVFGVSSDSASFQRTAEALGLDPASPRVALALDVHLPEVLPSRMEEELDRIVAAVSSSMKVPPGDLVRTLHRSRIVIWIPAVRGDSVLTTDSLMRAHVKDVLNDVSDVRAIGVGLMNSGAQGWASSVTEACRALELRRRAGASTGVAFYSDYILDESVLHSETTLRYLESLIDRISHEQDLLHTLAVFFEHGQHRKNASEKLGIHPNTLNYRLGRIEEIVGANLSETNWIAKLHVAIQLRMTSERYMSMEMP